MGKWIHRSVVSVSTNSTFLIERYSVRLSLFWSIKVIKFYKGLDLANQLRLNVSWYFVRSSTVQNNQVYGTVGFPVRVFIFKRLFNSQLPGTPIVYIHSRLYSSFISQSFHLEILNTDFQTKFWRYHLQSLQRLSTRVFADFGGNNYTDFGGNNYTEFRIGSRISIQGSSFFRLSNKPGILIGLSKRNSV